VAGWGEQVFDVHQFSPVACGREGAIIEALGPMAKGQ